MQTLTETATEGSYFLPEIPLPGNATSVTWSLATLAGEIINNRQQVSVSAEDPLPIVLSGDDLPCDGAVTTIAVVIDATCTVLDSSVPYREGYLLKIVALPIEPFDGSVTTILDSDVIADDTVIDDDTIMGG